MQTYSQLIQVSTEPPLGCRIICHGAAEIFVDDVVETKVVFTRNSSSVRFEGTVAGRIAVGVKGVSVETLPESHCSATPCRISTDIHIIHRETLGMTIIRHDVKVAERAPKVISVVNLLLHLVEAAGCSPVLCLAAESFHSIKSLAVRVPVGSLVVDWCVLQKRLASKMRQIF